MSFLDEKGVKTLSSLMKKEIKNTVESTKEQLFVVTVTPKEEPPTEDEDSTIYSCTPSVTFEEAVAQVKSGKKVVVRVEHLGDFQMRYESSPNLLISDDEFYLSHDQNIKTFHPFISQHFQWSKGGLILITYNMLPKWIGDTKPTYTASEVGADVSGAAAQALTDAEAYADTKAPGYTYSTTDLAENSPLETGKLYFVYE